MFTCVHGKGDYLAYSEEEHPVALQLGGGFTAALAVCEGEEADMMRSILNVGCPSDRLRTACLVLSSSMRNAGCRLRERGDARWCRFRYKVNAYWQPVIADS